MELEERIRSFREISSKENRDLLWMIQNSALSEKMIPEFHFNPWFPSDLDFLFRTLKSGSATQNPIQPNPLLGKYAEQLFLQALLLHPKVQVLANHIPIRNEGQSIGEIDFLIRYQEQYIHLEFALKYYIKSQESEKLIGPNARDEWSKKREKLISKQISLANRHRSNLPLSLQEIKWEEKALVFGAIFTLIETRAQEFRNWAIRQKDLTYLEEKAAYFSSVDSKLDWIFPFAENPDLQAIQVLEEKFSALKKAKLLVLYDQKKIPISWGFILPNEWPSEFNLT